jgi:hypothetical protein
MTKVTRPAEGGEIVAAVLLAPVLVGTLWLEVIGGTTVLWYGLQPGPWNHLSAILPVLVASLGPAMVLAQTIRTRMQGLGVLERVLRIETFSLMVSGPLALVAALLILGMASL